jgi:hypothetical protein
MMVGMARPASLLFVTMLTAGAVGFTPPAGAASNVVHVRFVDRYHHGGVEVWLNANRDMDPNLPHSVHTKLHDGERTGWLAVTPAPSGNDIWRVERLKDHSCGTASAGVSDFVAGSKFRIKVRSGYRCGGIGGPTLDFIRVD